MHFPAGLWTRCPSASGIISSRIGWATTNGVKAHMDYYQSTGVDYIKIMSDGYDAPADYSGVRKASDWGPHPPGGKNVPVFYRSTGQVKRINDALQGDCLTFYNILRPLFADAAGGTRITWSCST